MNVIPGLTTTVPDAIPGFIHELRASGIRTIALFPTAIGPSQREQLYRELEAIPDLFIPHVHLRSDFSRKEIDYLMRTFGTEVFNIHPAASDYPFGAVPADLSDRFYMENVDVAVAATDFARVAGMCPDYAHLENAILHHRTQYVLATLSQMRSQPLGCCHISAIRVGDPNGWNGGWDHHNFRDLSEFDYMHRYPGLLPSTWLSLEVENPLHEQLEAANYLENLLGEARSIA